MLAVLFLTGSSSFAGIESCDHHLQYTPFNYAGAAQCFQNLALESLNKDMATHRQNLAYSQLFLELVTIKDSCILDLPLNLDQIDPFLKWLFYSSTLEELIRTQTLLEDSVRNLQTQIGSLRQDTDLSVRKAKELGKISLTLSKLVEECQGARKYKALSK